MTQPISAHTGRISVGVSDVEFALGAHGSDFQWIEGAPWVPERARGKANLKHIMPDEQRLIYLVLQTARVLCTSKRRWVVGPLAEVALSTRGGALS